MTTKLLWALLAVVCGTLSLLTVFCWRIGPVIYVISARRGHGIHTGDLLLGVPLGIAAAAIAVALWVLADRTAGN